MMISGNDNTGVTIKVTKLLEAIRTNKNAHRQTFLEAQEGFREEVISVLDSRLKDARAGKRIDLRITLPEPEDHTRDYDRIIRMLEMCTKDEVFVSENEFSCYVQDDWGWKQQFTAVTSNYTAKR